MVSLSAIGVLLLGLDEAEKETLPLKGTRQNPNSAPILPTESTPSPQLCEAFEKVLPPKKKNMWWN